MLWLPLQETHVFSNTRLPFKNIPVNLPSILSDQLIHDIAFDKDGIIFISSNNAIYIGNGIFWEKHSLSGTPSLFFGKSNVYFFTNSDAGIISRDSAGNHSLSSFLTLFKNQALIPSNITDLKAAEGKVFIKAGQDLFRITGSLIHTEDHDFEQGKLFYVNNEIILYKPGSGFRRSGPEFSGTSGTLVNPDFLLNHSNGYLACSSAGNQLFILDRDFSVISLWNPEINGKPVITGKIKDNLFFYTTKNSLFILPENGKYIHSLDITGDFQPEKVSRIEYAGNKFWIIQDCKLSFIEYPPVFWPLSFSGIQGIITSSAVQNDTIYLGSDEGLYMIAPGDNIPVKIINGKCRKIIKTSSSIIVLTEAGIYSPGRDQDTEMLYHGYAKSMVYSELSNSIFFSRSFEIVEINLNEPRVPGMDKIIATGVDAEILHLHNDHLYYTDHEKTGRLNLMEDTSAQEWIPLITGGFIINIFTWKDKVHFLTENMIVRINEDLTHTRIKTEGIPSNYLYHNIIINQDNSYWINTKNLSGRFKLFLGNEDDICKPISPPVYNESYPYTICHVKGGQFLISTGNFSFLLNPFNIPLDSPGVGFRLFINKIISSHDTIYNGTGYSPEMKLINHKLKNIPYKNRSLVLELGSPFFSQAEFFFTYELQGRKNLISEYTSTPLIELNDLRTGNYTLLITSYDSLLNKSYENIISFRISAPGYLSWYAITVYIMLVLLTGFIIYKHYKIKELQKIELFPGSNVSLLVTKELPGSELFSDTIKPVPHDKLKWEKYEIATVLFSDIQGFTKIAEQMNPELLIDALDVFFYYFDSVCEKFNIEKIKTIGDAYMAAGGIPVPNSTNPVEVVLAALEMQLYMSQLKNTRTDVWDLRIGIHSGPVIGGIIGHKKSSYDIWGDTVNTASRMESSGEPGKVNISGTTYNLIKDFFICEYRGKLPVKYKGNIDMYFVKGLRPELSINLSTLPNKLCFLKLQLLRLTDLEKFIFTKLETELPDDLHFHTLDYIKHVYNHTLLLSKGEDLNTEDTLLLRTAVLFMFTGLTETYNNYENRSAQFARQLLPQYKYSEKQINILNNLILSSKLQYEPQNYLEKIIYDIKNEHYGRSDFLESYKMWFYEIDRKLKKITVREWKELQIRFLKQHEYYTLSAKRLMEVPPELQIKNIISDQWHEKA